ncbi:cyclomaltodextrin glucanotransferase [Pseudoxanthomonas winnipegensis]|uniref:Cyclomaltodextrin glucanotransferase n=1 Tax=Pseudoxanthomonas winnipegensis TaxID=2480810 RepID=A0ABY1WGD4_9GAMM|nr:cyclomaltodextrin glucanotransferase [Pseudoxanthomonas winnipegensis]TAA20944.1 cyclomaltodextrin glucanotransferase [Pseudoxanthomonas winnipegensis]TAH72413.1 cyclomaltodextrin glucanotransferase [Pseudoxanthomonas winnipegensis]
MRTFCLSLLALSLAVPARADELYGTLEPFASKAIYFVMTDRFVNGDPSNDHRDQGGRHRTFDLPTPGAPAGQSDNIGYLGGDFKGIVANAGYIHDMGFGAVWMTPIVDNPDEAFTGGEPVRWGSAMTDRGKTGYHGYWGVNFYKLDEHLPSKGLDFAGFTRAMKGQQLDVVLDIVANHGSPAYSMPKAQPKFGQIFDKDGRKLADHQNLDPAQLDPKHNPMHAFYNTGGGLAQLSDLAEDNPAVLDYLAGAYEQWIAQGAAAFRVDTIGWMPHRFWKQFADRIRARHPGFFMFGEAFDYDAAFIAAHTLERNGHYSVLDFPQRARLSKVFGKEGGGYEELERTLYLEDGPYANPYDLVTFYDNHDMARLDASDAGFIDANNWLFTARGIPAIYYGSETGFMRGAAEHAGNRNYYGQQRIDAAGDSAIYRNLKRIANLRRDSIALQRGLQLNLTLKGDNGAFYRVYEHDGRAQTALVLLNKADKASTLRLETLLQSGTWRDGFDGSQVRIDDRLALEVPAHGVRVLFYDGALTNADLRKRLAEDMGHRLRD